MAARLLCLLALLSACSAPAEEEVTFFIAADTHFGFPGCAERNARQIEALRALPGTPWPPEVGGVVGPPRFLLVCGDLTEKGEEPSWREFLSAYGALPFPVWAATGNHDRVPKIRRPVLDGVKERQGALVRSFEAGPMHFASLDLYPGRKTLEWLRKDLAAVPPERPIVLFLHYSILGPYSDWWKEEEKAAFRAEIGRRRVIGIFHGHWHGSEHYSWQGLDVYGVGSPKSGKPEFGVARLRGGEFSVAAWDHERRAFTWRHRKRI